MNASYINFAFAIQPLIMKKPFFIKEYGKRPRNELSKFLSNQYLSQRTKFIKLKIHGINSQSVANCKNISSFKAHNTLPGSYTF